MTIIFNSKDVEIIFKNVDDFNKFWYYDSGGTCNFEGDSISSWKAFHRQDCTLHRPQSETIDGEVWYVNDGKQPVKDDVRVDVMFKIGEKSIGNSRFWNWGEGKGGEKWRITHWRLAK